MGYQTDLIGQFNLDKPLKPEHKAYLTAFNETRRMVRDAVKAKHLPDPIREATGLPVGYQGQYFVGGGGFMGQDDDGSVLDHNYPPQDQPGLWCQWVPNDDGTAIVWDQGEKFYEYFAWIKYIVDHFLIPWGYSITGEIAWQGERSDDAGTIQVQNNEFQILRKK